MLKSFSFFGLISSSSPSDDELLSSKLLIVFDCRVIYRFNSWLSISFRVFIDIVLLRGLAFYTSFLNTKREKMPIFERIISDRRMWDIDPVRDVAPLDCYSNAFEFLKLIVPPKFLFFLVECDESINLVEFWRVFIFYSPVKFRGLLCSRVLACDDSSISLPFFLFRLKLLSEVIF